MTGATRLVSLLSLLVVGLAVGLAGCGSDEEPPALQDARQACEILHRVPSLGSPNDTSTDGRASLSAALDRYGAVVSLARAAAEVDRSYQPFADALGKPQQVLSQTFDVERANRELATARTACIPFN